LLSDHCGLNTHIDKGAAPSMTVFFLSNAKNKAKKLLLRVLAIIVPQNKITIIKNTDELEYHLRQQFQDTLIAVLLPADKNELTDILSLQKLLGDIPLILILPDRENNTIAMGYKLHPRFITYADSDFLDVATVVMKMKTKMEADGGAYEL
jgi:hypothetical protein